MSVAEAPQSDARLEKFQATADLIYRQPQVLVQPALLTNHARQGVTAGQVCPTAVLSDERAAQFQRLP
ncbi:hypothetical protein DFAR_330022 [Desulfarculales bacterium]